MLLRNKIILPSTLVWFCWVTLLNGQSKHFRNLRERFFRRDNSHSSMIRAFLPEPHLIRFYHTPNSDVTFHFVMKNSDDGRYHYSPQSGSNLRHSTPSQIPRIESSDPWNKKDAVINSPKLSNDSIQVFNDIPKKVNTSNPIKEIKFPVIPLNFGSNDNWGGRKPFTGITDDADEDEDGVIPIIPFGTGLEGLGNITPKEKTNNENIMDKSSEDNPVPTNTTHVIPPEKQHPASDIPPVTTNALPNLSFDNLEDILNQALPNTTIFINSRSDFPDDDLSKYKVNTLSNKSEDIVKDDQFSNKSDPENPPVPLNRQPNTLLIGDWMELSKQMYHKLGSAEKKKVYEANKAIISGKYLNRKSDNDGADVELKPLEGLYLVTERKNVSRNKKPDSDLKNETLNIPFVYIGSRFDGNDVDIKNGTSESLDAPTGNKSENVKMNSSATIPYVEKNKNNSIVPEFNKKNNNIKKEDIASNLIEPQIDIKEEDTGNNEVIKNKTTTPIIPNDIFDKNSNKMKNIKNNATSNFNGLKTKNRFDADTSPNLPKNNATKYNLMGTPTSTAPTDLLSIFDRNFKDRPNGKKSATRNVSTAPTKNRNISKNTTSATPTDFISIFDPIFNNSKLFDGTEAMNNIRNLWTSGSRNNDDKNVKHPPLKSNTASKPSPTNNKTLTEVVLDDVIQRLLRSLFSELTKS